MPNEEFLEKRKFARFLISIPLKYVKMSIKQLTNIVTSDISVEGLGLITAEELPLNTALNICLVMPDNGEEIALDVEALWSKCNGTGSYRCGLKLKNTRLKPIPLVLRTINSRF
jgi:hypothetical protein